MKKILLGIALLPLMAFAQMTFTGGPLNTVGECWTLWASGDTAFMGFNDGLHRTTDGGVSWDHLTNGIPFDADPRTIEYSSGVLLVGTNDGSRTYQSTDFGDSFTGGGISSIAIPTASTSGPGLSMMGGTTFDPHVYDFGSMTWASTGNGGITHGMRYLGGDTVWMCSGGISSGVTKYSHDNGVTWTQVATEPETDIGGGLIFSTIAQDFLKVGSRILVAANFNGFPVLYTDDYGTTWQASDLPNQAYSDYGTRFLKINDNHILSVNLSGIWKSVDQGATWAIVQLLGAIRTMALWKNNHLLVGTANGVFEFGNYGEGGLLTQYGITATPSNLVQGANNHVLSGTASGVYQYSTSIGNWTLLNDTISNGSALVSKRLAIVGDSLYSFNDDNFHVSGDGGATFIQGSKAPFTFQNPTMVAALDGKKFVGSKPAGNQQPKIFYSSNNGGTYTEATFSNTVSYGLGGAGINYVERFMETSSALIADMNAGFAISTDGGVNWTFSGGPWENTFLAVKGDAIYHFNMDQLFNSKTLEVSSDNGTTWTPVPFTGLPNAGGSNYNGYFGVWNLNGDICIYNAHEDPRGIYKFNPGSDEWEILSGTATSIEDWDGITDMHFIAGNYYTNWFLNGTWGTGALVGVDEVQSTLNLHVYPNPFTDQITISTTFEGEMEVNVVDQLGRSVLARKAFGGQTKLDFGNLTKGWYLLKVSSEQASTVSKVLKL